MDIAELEKKRARLMERYATRNEYFARYVRAYAGEVWDTPPAPEEERVTLPTCFSLVETIRSLLAARPPVISVPPSKEKKVAQDRADRVEKYLGALWEHELDGVFRELVWQYITLGWCAVRVVWEKAEEEDFPISVQVVHPGNLYPAYDHKKRLRAVFFVDTVPAWQVREDFPKALPELDDDEEVELVDYWEAPPKDGKGRKQWAVNAVYAVGHTDTWIRRPTPMPHYPVIPYVLGLCNPLPWPDSPEYEGVSLLYPIVLPGQSAYGLEVYRNRLMSQLAQTVADYANPVTIVYTNQPEGAPPFDTSHGAVNYLYPDERAEYLQYGNIPPALQGLWQAVESEIERATIPKVFYGQTSGDISGIALNILTTPAMSRLASVQQGLQDFLEAVLRTVLRLTEANMGERLAYLTADAEGELRKTDIGGYYRVRALLSANLPKDVPNMVALLIQAVRSGMMSKRTAVDLLQQYIDTGITSPDDEIRRIIMEEILKQPDMLAAMAKEAARRYGLRLEEKSRSRPKEEKVKGLPPELLHGRAAPAATLSLEDQLRESGLPAPPGEGEPPSPYGAFPPPGGTMPPNPMTPPGGQEGEGILP